LIDMSIREATEIFERFLEREKQRNIQMIELSRLLGFDVSFSNEEMIENAEMAYAEHVSKEIQKKIEGVFGGRS
jgi:DNA-binding ferritin-like protein (Dps family)